MNNEKKLIKNLVTSILTYGISFLLSFFLSPYITKTLGVEANGFVTLANQCVGYISLITVALTSMAGRFISISIFQDNKEEANIYYNSVVGASAILAVILSIPCLAAIFKIDLLIQVSPQFLADVKILFLIVFLNFLLGLLLQVYSIATYVTNKLYLASFRSIEGNLIRCGFIILAYAFFDAKMYYVSLAALISGIYTYVWNIHYTRTLLPQMQLNVRYFRIDAIKELVRAGSWNVVIQLNNILNTGLDLLLGNLILGEAPMGILAVAKTIPTSVSSMLNSVSGVFLPEMTQLYAQGDMDGFTNAIKRSIKILALMFNIPMVFLIVYGANFYSVWQPRLDSRILQILSLLTVCTIMVSGSTAAVFGIFTIANRLRFHSLTSLAGGVLNVVIVLTMLYFIPKEYGLYVIAGVSSVLIILRNYLITFPYAASCIKQKKSVFTAASLQTVLGVLGASAICFGVKFVYEPTSWLGLILSGFITAIVSVTVNMFVVLKKSDRAYLFGILKRKCFNR